MTAALAAIQRRLLHPVTGLGGALRREAVAVPLVLVLVAAVAAAALAWRRVERERWARQTVMPEIARLADDMEGAARAFRLAREIEPILGDDPRFQELSRQVTYEMTLETDPPGVAVSYQDYLTPAAPWQPLGDTPLKDQPVRVPAGSPSVFIKPVRTESFWLDRHEVTNAEYKKFVDAGGYHRPDLWKHAFVLEGRALSREQALARLVDTTGRPRPANWELGTFPTDKGDLPVGGVSWYEAAAFAEFAGKALPTVYH